ncbi:MAG: hypothetical protein ABIE55_00425 [Candidatus Aenigmatarchaeota archaeon]
MSNRIEGKKTHLTAVIESNPDDQRILYRASCDREGCKKRCKVLNCYQGENLSLAFMDPPSDLERCEGVVGDLKLIDPKIGFKEDYSIEKFVYESISCSE